MNRKYRLPGCRKTTTDVDFYVSRWRSVGERLCELFSSKDDKCELIGFDPDMLFAYIGGYSFNIHIDTAIILIKNIDGKLPWE